MKKIFLAIFFSLFFVFPKNLHEAGAQSGENQCTAGVTANCVDSIVNTENYIAPCRNATPESTTCRIMASAFSVDAQYPFQVNNYTYNHNGYLVQKTNEKHILYDYTSNPNDIYLIEDTTWANTQECSNGVPAASRPITIGFGKNYACGEAIQFDGEITAVEYTESLENNPFDPNAVACTNEFTVETSSTNQLIYQGPAICGLEPDPINVIAIRNIGGAGTGEMFVFCEDKGLCAWYQGLDFTQAENQPSNWDANTNICNLQSEICEMTGSGCSCGDNRNWELNWWQCNQVARDDTGAETPEFHSLRPYPASFCPYQESTTLVEQCSNDLVIVTDISVTRADGNCSGEGGNTCSFEINNGAQVTINTDDLELPILGNTELVPNGASGTNSLSFEERVNEYVSWYLNGVIQRAEERYFVSPRDIYELVNFSGPIRKLLPQRVQTNLRKTQQNEAGSTRHDQIVACMDGENPTTCYIRLEEEYKRVSDPITSYVPYTSTEDHSGWIMLNKNLYDGLTETIFDGGTEITISDIRFPYVNDWDWKEAVYFAHIFEGIQLGEALQSSYLPGKPPKRTFNLQAPLLPTLNNPLWPDWITEYLLDNGLPILPDELNDLDIDIEIPLPDALQPDGPDFNEIPDDVRNVAQSSKGCEIINTRTNPGDDLYGELDRLNNPANPAPPSEVARYEPSAHGRFEFKTSFTHEFGDDEDTFNVRVHMNVPIETESPGLDDIWGKLVASNGSIFRRMFPKIGTGSARSEIVDIPGESQASYQSISTDPNPGTINSYTTYAGDYDSQKPGSTASVYFPHLGGIYEYFLKDIQKMLRPKGFTDTEPVPGSTKSVCSINCNESATLSSEAQRYGFLRDTIIDLADRWTENQENPGKNHAKECFNDVVNQSVAKGVNPALTLIIWLNESGASNYTSSVTSCVTQDFGINKPEIASDFKAQLGQFLLLPSSAGYEDCAYNEDKNWESPIHGFLNRFKEGGCDPENESGNNYYELIRNEWEFLNLSCSLPDYPTDMNCP